MSKTTVTCIFTEKKKKEEESEGEIFRHIIGALVIWVICS